MYILTSTLWCLHSLMTHIQWVSYAAQLQACRLYILNKIQVWSVKQSTKTRRLETSKSIKSSVMFQPLLQIPIDTGLADSLIFHLRNLDMLRISCTCLISLMKPHLSHILNLWKHLKCCSFCMLNMSWTAQLQQSGICHHQELMSTHVLQVLQVHYMDLNMEVLMKQC